MNRRGGKHRRSILGANGTFTSNRPSTTVSPKNETDAPATMGARGTSGRSRTRITAKSWPSDAVASSRAFGTCFHPISPPQNPSPATFTDHSMTISSATPRRTRTPSIVGGIFPMSKNARKVRRSVDRPRKSVTLFAPAFAAARAKTCRTWSLNTPPWFSSESSFRIARAAYGQTVRRISFAKATREKSGYAAHSGTPPPTSMRVGVCFARIKSVSSLNSLNDPSFERNNASIVSAAFCRREASRTPSHRATFRWNGVADLESDDEAPAKASLASFLFLFVSSSAPLSPLFFSNEVPEEPSSSTGSYRSASSTNPRDFVAAAPSSSAVDFNAYSPRTSSFDGKPAKGKTTVPITSCAL
mmetsp:Transcript_2298/g.9564  ORF Transcript_2298/g.9564 Transcript_2298/m.9564 type:complete len:358 (+) Transcript_2298:1528-2601(+)